MDPLWNKPYRSCCFKSILEIALPQHSRTRTLDPKLTERKSHNASCASGRRKSVCVSFGKREVGPKWDLAFWLLFCFRSPSLPQPDQCTNDSNMCAYLRVVGPTQVWYVVEHGHDWLGLSRCWLSCRLLEYYIQVNTCTNVHIFVCCVISGRPYRHHQVRSCLYVVLFLRISRSVSLFAGYVLLTEVRFHDMCLH